MVSGKLQVAIDELAHSLGVEVDASPWDEHQRWSLYREAMKRRVDSELSLLRRAVDEETNYPLIVGVLLEFAERGELDRMSRAFEKLDAKERSRVCSREADALILEEVLGGAGGGPVENWSDWVQSRVAGASSSQVVLADLATGGRTRRIRAAASERLRRIRGARRS